MLPQKRKGMNEKGQNVQGLMILIRTGLEWFTWSGHWYSHSGDAASLVSEENKIKIKIPQIQEIHFFSQIRKFMKEDYKCFHLGRSCRSTTCRHPEVYRSLKLGGIQEPEHLGYIHKDMGVEAIIWKSQNHIFSVGKLPLWQNLYIVCAEFNLKSIYPVGSCIVLLAIWSAMVSTFSRHKLSPILADL